MTSYSGCKKTPGDFAWLAFGWYCECYAHWEYSFPRYNIGTDKDIPVWRKTPKNVLHYLIYVQKLLDSLFGQPKHCSIRGPYSKLKERPRLSQYSFSENVSWRLEVCVHISPRNNTFAGKLLSKNSYSLCIYHLWPSLQRLPNHVALNEHLLYFSQHNTRTKIRFIHNSWKF